MKLAFPLLAMLFSSCATQAPVKPPPFSGKFHNACVPEAIAMAEGLREAGVRSDVLMIGTSRWSHAVAVYVYPKKSSRVWAWDNERGSIPLYVSADPYLVARSWISRAQINEPIRFAEYLR